jgi:galactokinase
VEEFCKVVGENYKKKTQLTPEFYIADVGNGVYKIF